MKNTYMLCIDEKDREYALEGSALKNCCECKKKVWVSPSGIEEASNRQALFICLKCMGKHQGRLNRVPSTELQVKELLESGVTSSQIERLNQLGAKEIIRIMNSRKGP